MTTEETLILVIEDNDDVRENLCELLSLTGYTIISAPNGMQGVKEAITHLPKLILCDVMMPELDGFGVLRILHQNPKTVDIPFIFLTAKADKTDFRKGMGLGADDYITKPYDDIELLDAIQMRLDKNKNLAKAVNEGSESGFQSLINLAKADERLKNLSEDREIRRFRRKDFIYEAEKYPKYVFLILSGCIKISTFNEWGKEFISKLYSKDDFVGLQNIISNQPYSDNAIALDDVEVRLIPAKDFQLLLNTDREIAYSLLKMLSDQNIVHSHQIIDQAYSSVRKKVANALCNLAEMQGNAIHIMRDDLAALAGTAKETVIRTLTDFKNEGLIDIEDTQINITNLKSLQDMPQ